MTNPLRDLRLARGLSIPTVAVRAGMAIGTYRRLELMPLERARIGQLRRVGEVLGFDLTVKLEACEPQAIP